MTKHEADVRELLEQVERVSWSLTRASAELHELMRKVIELGKEVAAPCA